MNLTPEIVERIESHARQAYPDECCGALIGRDGEILEARALSNTTEEGRRRRFRIRPEEYRRLETHADNEGLEILGFYHSHPDHPARPSQYDLDHAWPNLIYLIVASEANRTGEITAWKLAEDRSAFEQIEINDQDLATL